LKRLRWLLRGCALCFVLGALFHFVALEVPELGTPSPPWRHALFFGINTSYAIAFWRSPRWLVFAYLPLGLQQTWSHGSDWLQSAAPWHRTQDLLALAAVPLFAGLAFARRSARLQAERSDAGLDAAS
jgi:hypothetical protein